MMILQNSTYHQRLIKDYPIATVSVRGHVVEIFCKEFIKINSQDLKEFMRELHKDVGDVHQFKFITHIQPTTIFELTARWLYLKTLNKNFKSAEAIVTENISQQFILETLLDEVNIDIPLKIFRTREEAIKWLKQLN